MFRRLAWLWIAVMVVGSIAGHADAVSASMDRHMAPDEFPTHVVKILRTTNKAQTNSYVPVVFTMRNNNPFNVIRFLHRPVQTEEGHLFTFVSDDGNSGKVLFVVPQYMAESLEQLVKTLDRPGLTTSSGSLRVYRALKHRRADTSDPGFLTTAASFTTFNGSTFIIDPEMNALYFEDAPSGTQALDDALTDWLDVPTAMVQLAVKVFEIDAYNDDTIGLDYMSWKNGPGANLFAVGAFSEYGSLGRAKNMVKQPLEVGANLSGLPKKSFDTSGYNYAYEYNVSSAFFDYLAMQGKARVLNQVKLAALNTRLATLGAGDQLLYYKTVTSDPSGIRDSGECFDANDGRVLVGTTNQLINNQLVPVDTGLGLAFVPTIGEQTVQMEIAMIWSDYNGFSSDGFPMINERELSTTVRLGLGDEIVIGGLNRTVHVNSTQKVPFLGSLPIIGYIFGGETDQNRKTEVVVAIQPTAVTSYDIAKEDQTLIDQVAGKVEILEPETTVGFGMWGLDKEKSAIDRN